MQPATIEPPAGVAARENGDRDALAVAHADIAQTFAAVADQRAAGKNKVQCLCRSRRSALKSETAHRRRVNVAPDARENQGIHL